MGNDGPGGGGSVPSRIDRAKLRAPSGLRAARLRVAGEELLLLDWPLAAAPLPAALTAAESDVGALLLAGLPNPEIARRRGTSVRTVANQVASLFTKLGVRSRLELFAWRARGAPRRGEGAPR